MSRAYKCDRCGTLYTKDEWLPATKLTLVVLDNITNGLDVKDLCSVCQRELERWLENVQGETN